jgi:ketosteroid isomerase-like protein
VPQANEEIVRRGFEALNRGVIEGGKELLAPDCELRTLFTAIAGRTYRDTPGLISGWQT